MHHDYFSVYIDRIRTGANMLLVRIIVASAALILTALALDAGHYKNITAWFKRQWCGFAANGKKLEGAGHKHLTPATRSDVEAF
jgi:hypothetical protein